MSKRSALHFLVLVIFAAATTLFVLNKARQAISEINEFSDTSIYVGVKKIVQ